MKGFLAVAFAVSATPATAADSSWISNNDNERCGFFAIFEGSGETRISLSQSKIRFHSNRFLFIIENRNWSLKEGQKLLGSLRIESADDWFEAPALALNQALGFEIDEKYVMQFIYDRPIAVKITLNGKLLDRLNFEGFNDAYSEFDACRKSNGWLAEREAADEEAKQDAHQKTLDRTIPRDPFGPTKPVIKRSSKTRK